MICLLDLHDDQSTSNKIIDWKQTEDVGDLLKLVKDRPEYVKTTIRKYYELDSNISLIVNLHFDIPPVEDIDFSWEIKVLEWMYKMLELERVMWNLSTLGGAYSALGDYDDKYAETAARITQYQLKVASELEDPIILARCHLYMALSEAQRGKCTEATRTVRIIYKWACLQGHDLVQRCCLGLLMKIKAIRKFGKKPIEG